MKRILLSLSAVISLSLIIVIGLAIKERIVVAQDLSSCPALNCWMDGTASTPLGDTLTVNGTLNVTADGTLQQAGIAIELATTATEVVAATNVITAAESGTTFFLNDATEFVSTLPAVAAGLRYTFIVTAAPASADYTIVTDGSANVLNIVAWAGGIDDAADVAVARDVVTFVDAQAVVGDWLYCISDGTSWQCTGGAAVAAGLTTGQT